MVDYAAPFRSLGAETSIKIASILEHREHLLLIADELAKSAYRVEPMDEAIRQTELLLVEIGLSMAEAPESMFTQVDRVDFIEQARQVLEALGTDWQGGRRYMDNWIIIKEQREVNRDGESKTYLEITRREVDVESDHKRGHLSVSNPTTMAYDDEVIRHHSEHAYIARHLNNLYEENV